MTAAAAPAPATASTYSWAYAGAGAGQADVFQSNEGADNAEAAIDYGGTPLGTASVRSSAGAQYGVLKAATFGSASNAYGQGAAFATFTDSLTIGGESGQAFKVGGSYDLTYILAPDTRSNGTVHFEASLTSGSDFVSLYFFKLVAGTNNPATSPFDIYVTATISSFIGGVSTTTDFDPNAVIALPTFRRKNQKEVPAPRPGA